MITLSVIAKRTGLTKTTVSRILNHHDGYPRATRDRVLKTARELGYTPNPLSRALAGARSMSVGVLINSLDPLLAKALQAIERHNADLGCRSYVAVTGHHAPAMDADTVRDLLARRVDGLLVDNDQALPAEARTLLAEAGVPVVYLRTAPRHARLAVRIERRGAIKALVSRLKALGHQRVAYVRAADEAALASYYKPMLAELRQAGMLEWQDERWGLPTVREGADAVISADHVQEVYRMVSQLLQVGDYPTALLFPDDEWALAALAAARDCRVAVPEDLSIVGHDGHPLAALASPALTTFHEPAAEAALLGAQLLQQAIGAEQPLAERAEHTLHAELVSGGTLGRART
ncbi:LacI family DNA-binding transcriptional regulator [Phycisphaerales bacterium AB-hyl4]|uniref:LacI family DNA-binding transcriptional regulator n=1 Tax=Natronomicrosphaera hydrolytica TaxID=3242702 RepID=A0ABV4UBZ1_9BACT